MSQNSWLKIAVVLVVTASLLPAVHPVQATTAAIGQFYAGCGNFSVDVAVSGSNNDGNNVDRFRYYIVDGNNKTLYQEEATRTVGTTTGSMVFNLPYMFAPATKNPIQFAVVEEDSNGNPGAWVQSVSYMAPCLPASGTANRSGTFVPPKIVVGVIVADTPLYQGPANGPLSLLAHVGAQHQVVYRTPDGAWVAIFVGGNDLVWIPSGTINANFSLLAVQPTHIDGNSPSNPGGGTVVNPGAVNPGGVVPSPTGQTALVLTDLRLHNAPVFDPANVVNVIPSGTVVPVLGGSPDGAFVQVNYNGMVGWVAASFVRLGAAGGGGGTAAPATGVTAVTLADVRLHSVPNFDLVNVVTVVPFGAILPVLGRSADFLFVKVNYNGTIGWISSGFVRIAGSALSALPVVQ